MRTTASNVIMEGIKFIVIIVITIKKIYKYSLID